MANIDTSKIEGYEGMTAEEKIKALEGYTFADPDYSGYVKKDTFDKTASELAQVKKDLKARMTEDEVKKAEADAALTKLKEEVETLRNEKTISENKAQLIAVGYDETLAAETAKAMVEGDLSTVIKNQSLFIEKVKKDAKGQAMADTPKPAGKATDGSKTITKEQFEKMSLGEMTDLYNSNPDLYNELSK